MPKRKAGYDRPVVRQRHHGPGRPDARRTGDHQGGLAPVRRTPAFATGSALRRGTGLVLAPSPRAADPGSTRLPQRPALGAHADHAETPVGRAPADPAQPGPDLRAARPD